jgi:UrcA family protein
MNIDVVLPSLKTLVFVAATAAAVLAASVRADEVTVNYSVSAAGINLSQAAGAREFLRRLEHAARVVCTHGNRVDLVPLDDIRGCFEQTIGEAVRLANKPELTAVYLQTHSSQVATAYRVDVPVQVAAK